MATTLVAESFKNESNSRSCSERPQNKLDACCGRREISTRVFDELVLEEWAAGCGEVPRLSGLLNQWRMANANSRSTWSWSHVESFKRGCRGEFAAMIVERCRCSTCPLAAVY